MALPKKKHKTGELAEAQAADIAAERAEHLKANATRLMREAEQLRLENEDDEAARLEAEAADAKSEAAQSIEVAKQMRKKAELKAVASAAIKTPFNALGTVANLHFQTFKQSINPMMQLQGLAATLTPFTGAFDREKSRLLGGGDGGAGGFGNIFKSLMGAIDRSNLELKIISRSQAKLIIAENDTAKNVKDTESATRDVQQAVKDLRDILAPDSPSPVGPDAWEAFGTLPSTPMPTITGIAPVTQSLSPKPTGPSTTALIQKQTDALTTLVSQGNEQIELQQEQLKETKEGDEEARLRDARNRGQPSVKARPGEAEPGAGREENNRGGFFGNLLGNIGQLFSRTFGGLMSGIGRFLGPIAAGIAGLAGFFGLRGLGGGGGGGRGLFGLGGGGRGAAAVADGAARGGARGAAQAAAGAARGGANVVGRALAGGLGRRILGFLPGVGSVMSGIDAVAAAREGNWGGAALHGAAAVAGLIPGLGPLARLGIQTVAGTLGHMTNTAEGRQTDADRRARELQQSRPPTTPTPPPAPPMVITNNYNTTTGQGSPTVVAQYHKSLEDRRRELWAYTA